MSQKKHRTLLFRDATAGNGLPTTVQIASDLLASGADGKIYLLDGLSQPAVAKLYHPERLDDARRLKLEAMLGNVPDLPDIKLGGQRYVQLAWPLGLLFEKAGSGSRSNKETFVGFAMPTVDLERSTTLETLLSEKSRKAYRLPNHYGYQLAAARNVAIMIAELHAHGHHVIDLKPVNINVYTDKLFIAMLDCDGFSILGGDKASGAKSSDAHFPAHQYTADYIAPEAWRSQQPPEVLGEAQDRFALAVILFRLVNRGLHPFQGVPDTSVSHITTNQNRIAEGLYPYGQRPHRHIQPSPWSIHEQLPKTLRTLFDQAFTSQRRPSAAQWVSALTPFTDVTTGQLQACPKNSDHGVFAGLGCGHCVIEQQRGAVGKPSRQKRAATNTLRRNRRSATPHRQATGNTAGRATVGTAWQGPPGAPAGQAVVAPSSFVGDIKQVYAAWRSSGPSRWFVPLMPLLLMAALLLHQNRENLADWWAVTSYEGDLSKPRELPLASDFSREEATESEALPAELTDHSSLPPEGKRLTQWQAAIDAGGGRRLYELAYQRNRKPLQANDTACCQRFTTPEASGFAIGLSMLSVTQRLPLHYAVEKGVDPQLIALLLSLGFSATEQDADGYTPIQLAAYFGRLKALNVLLKNDRDPAELTNEFGPLPSAVQAVIGPGNSQSKVDDILALLTRKSMNTSGNPEVVVQRTPEYYLDKVDWEKRDRYAAAQP